MKDTTFVVQSKPVESVSLEFGVPIPLFTALASFPTLSMGPGGPLMTLREAAAYLKVSQRWLEAQRDVPRVDLAKPDSKKAMPRYSRAGLDEFMARRTAEGRD